MVQLLRERQLLAGVLLRGEWNQGKQQIEAQFRQAGIAVHYAPQNNDESAIRAMTDWQTTLGVAFCCGGKIPAALARAPKYGVVNLHASPLPEYRGADPIYWQIRNGEASTMLTAHMVDDGWDTGPVVAQLPIDISPRDTHHSVFGKLCHQLPGLLDRITESLTNSQHLELHPQPEGIHHKAPRVTEQNLLIDWRHSSAQQICDQVRAGNPQFGGARLSMGQGHAQLLQATPSQMPAYQAPAGTLIHLSPDHGLVVATKDSSLRLDIISNAEGVFDGYRFAQLYNLSAGMKFN
ncbi:MAG: hypothetical protein HLX50_01525 [Alteromonadaceae bacterium]|nr:hypothetical protein [Alteromonadaceae bacterium]